ncbi:MAG: FAD:protein FMN transferase [Verrucomicrobia bacterium]|nr:FAD:protein FMN transferase [Verrucomicrobiota bacterium]
MTELELFERMNAERLSTFRDFSRIGFYAMGTVNEIMFRAVSRAAAEKFKLDVFNWLAHFEATFSSFIDTSLVGRINREAGGDPVEINADAEELFALCDWFHWHTRGLFDPTSGPLLDLWDYHHPRKALPSRNEVASARSKVGWDKVERGKGYVRLAEEGMRIDLGGIGKEYAVDRLVGMAADAGINDIMVSLGRDIRVSGSPPEGDVWRLGLEHPDRPSQCWTGVAASNVSLCCSGDYQRYLEIDGQRYSHIIDPTTGYPAAGGCRAAWVLAKSCVQAGILSTCMCMLGHDKGMKLIESTTGAEGCIWTTVGIYQSGRFTNYVLHESEVTQ